jgi:hypothetical protein
VPPEPPPSTRYAWYVVALLLMAYAFGLFFAIAALPIGLLVDRWRASRLTDCAGR